MNAKNNSNILFYGYTSIINRLSVDITRIKNGIAIYDLLNKNIAKLTLCTPETQSLE